MHNISGRLDFNTYITSKWMKLLKLSNIGRIPTIAKHTFIVLKTIDVFEIENTHIEYIEEQFSFVNVSRFVLTNVTIDRTDRLNLSENGTTLTIRNSELRNIATSLNFANFRDVQIIGSRFGLEKPGMMSIEGDRVLVKDSVFSNASMNLVAADAITIRGICADGKSALRLSSGYSSRVRYINSTNNRLPNEIVYLTKNQLLSSEHFVSQNNTVCKAGNCKCSRNNGQNASRAYDTVFILVCLYSLVTLYRDFSLD